MSSSSGSSSGSPKKRSPKKASPKKASSKRGSRAQKALIELEGILYTEMYTVGAASLEELWELNNAIDSEYIPAIHHVIVVVDGQQYLFRENADKTEIFGCKLLKLNKERIEID
jgi:hypothetical protein